MNTFPYIILLKGKLKLKLVDGTILDIENPELVTEEMFPLFTDITYEYPWPGTWREVFVNANDYLANSQKKVARLIAPEKEPFCYGSSGFTKAVHTGKKKGSVVPEQKDSTHLKDMIDLVDKIDKHLSEPVSSETQEEQRKFAACIGMMFLSNEGEPQKAIDLVVKQFLLTRKS